MRYNEEIKEQFKSRLKTIVSKKFDTTMIYALSQFEKEFGHLFGFSQSEENLTEEQKENRIKWNRCRNNILNNGNRQKRNASAEIDMHDIIWNRYRTTFMPVK